ncbi:MAG TPA: DUF6515 family protein [Chitinophagaceae bacterium]|nr:DUF6515 family protein [Chitinophagaceae bacterium]
MNRKDFALKGILLAGLLFLLGAGVHAQRRGYHSYGYRPYYHSYGYRPVYHAYAYRPVYSHYFYGPRVYAFSGPYLNIGFGGIYYRYYGGYFYRPFGGYFRVVAPPIGITIGVLPPGYREIYVGGYPYYYFNGIYYAPGDHNDYRVVDPPVGARVPELPRDARVVVIDGRKYYELNGTYYKEEITADNEIWYTVVGNHGRLDTGNSNGGYSEPQGNPNRDPNPNGYTNPDQQSNPNPQPDNRINPGEGSGSGSSQGNDGTARNTYKMGDKVDKLPADSRQVLIGGKKYYESPDGVYYQEIIGRNQVTYEIVGKATDNP